MNYDLWAISKSLSFAFFFPFVIQEIQQKEAAPLQTKLCEAVAVVLGTTQEVKNLDQARRHHKSKLNNKEAANGYLDKLALVQSKVLSEYRKLKNRFDEWEREFFVTHNCTLALPEDIKSDPEATELMKQIKYAKALLKEWKMDALI